MNRKHSYRTLAKRHFAALVLAALNGNIKGDEPVNSERERQLVTRAFEVANELKKQGSRANLYQYAPYKNEIRKIISKQNQL